MKKGEHLTDKHKAILQQAFADIREMRKDQIIEILDYYRIHSKIEGLNHNDLSKEMEMNRKSIRPYTKALLEEGSIIKKGDKYVLPS